MPAFTVDARRYNRINADRPFLPATGMLTPTERGSLRLSAFIGGKIVHLNAQRRRPGSHQADRGPAAAIQPWNRAGHAAVFDGEHGFPGDLALQCPGSADCPRGSPD